MQIAYQASVGARQISGVSHALQWSATALGETGVQVQLRVPISSFDSGHPEFDALLRTAANAEHYPYVEVEGIARDGRFEGTMTIRGVSQPLAIDVHLTQLNGNWVANAAFTFDLTTFGIAMPGVGPRVSIDFVARVPMNPEAVISGGAVSSVD